MYLERISFFVCVVRLPAPGGKSSALTLLEEVVLPEVERPGPTQAHHNELVNARQAQQAQPAPTVTAKCHGCSVPDAPGVVRLQVRSHISSEQYCRRSRSWRRGCRARRGAHTSSSDERTSGLPGAPPLFRVHQKLIAQLRSVAQRCEGERQGEGGGEGKKCQVQGWGSHSPVTAS